jgi:hypothetical protein
MAIFGLAVGAVVGGLSTVAVVRAAEAGGAGSAVVGAAMIDRSG